MIRPEEVFRNIYSDRSTPASFVVWKVARDLPYFSGHFPEAPILPAIAILDASTYLLQQALQQPELKLKSIESAKFLSPIVPDQMVRIEFAALKPGEWQVEWTEDGTARALASLRVQI